MSHVYYSLANLGDGRYERQWLQSIRSLRRRNASVEVHLVLYGPVSNAIVRESERQRVALNCVGGYRERLEQACPEYADALSGYPALHKMLSLRFLPLRNARQVLYLDCDTFFFGDVASIFVNHQSRHIYAREEPWSRRSPYGYRPSYLDEDALARTCAAEQLQFIPPCNTGVMLFNHGLWAALAAASERSLTYCWRLLASICEHDELARECSPALREKVRQGLMRSPEQPPLPYPSTNWWIVEEIATLLMLGSLERLTHDVLRRADVAQNGEFKCADGSSLPTLVHYFSNLEDEFFGRVGRIGCAF
jgi:hypothetical protein